MLANAKIDLDRYEKLAATNAINRQQADTQRALVQQDEALVQADQAAIENARATLGYTSIVAPIDGRTGIRMVDEGNIVHASSSPGIVVITQIKPISVIFNLPQQNLAQINTGLANGALPVDALRSDDNSVIDRGKLTVLDNQVDPSTGTVKLKAEFPNADVQLWPGQFVNVRLLIDTLKQVVVIPTGAVQRGPTGTFVYVVRRRQYRKNACRSTVSKQDETQIRRRQVALTPRERVVTTGFARLTDGAQVEIGTAGNPAPAPNTRPRGGQRGSGIAPVEATPADSGRTRRNERLLTLHSAPDRHLPARRRGDAGGRARLLVAAGIGAAAGRLSHHPGHHPASRRQPRHHRLAGDGAARAPVRPDSGARRHDLVEFVRHQPGDAAIRSQPRHRRRLTGRAIGDQCRGSTLAAQPALPAALFEGEPRRHADRHAWRSTSQLDRSALA